MAKESFKVIATAIIRKGNKYLIAQRAAHEKLYPSRWTVPGGGLEDQDVDESLALADGQVYEVLVGLLQREVREEVGLEIGYLRYVTSLCYGFPTPRLCISFCADHVSGEVVLSDELVDFAWVTSQEAVRYELLSGIHEELFIADDVFAGRPIREWTYYQGLVRDAKK
ncbi:MAG: NUDIX hydrolase [Candidatus Woesearchaeota archaeon]